jgi:hypothetical protein
MGMMGREQARCRALICVNAAAAENPQLAGCQRHVSESA